jgi:N-acetyl-anhydromuramyl-L-alanine amidase AmpD
MKRIIIHWSAGTHKPSASDKKHYHYIVGGDGAVVEGNLPVSANQNTATEYAAHTRGLNTGSIGVAFAAMHGAKERPFSAGKHPITEAQVEAMTRLVFDLSNRYDIAVTPETILTHAEVQPTLGVEQRGKWDVTWLPDMDRAGEARTVGDLLRQKVRDYRQDQLTPTPPPSKARTKKVQSKTVQASIVQGASAVGGAVAAFQSLDGTAQIIAMVGCVLVALTAMFILKERLKAWASGWH